MQTQLKGTSAEQLARNWLQQQGLEFVEKNYAARSGEIDLVMREDIFLVFIEVRYRKLGQQHSNYGGAVASVDLRKQRKLVMTARHYLQNRRLGSMAARIDVLDISGSLADPCFDWIKNAIPDCG